MAEIRCIDRDLTYAQIRHLVLEEAAQAVQSETMVVCGQTYKQLGADHFAAMLRGMRYTPSK